MKDGSMRFAQKTAMMKSEECTLPQRMQIETALKNYVLEAIVESIQSDSFSDVYSKLLDNYKGFSTTGKTYRTPRDRERAEDRFKKELQRCLDLRNRIYGV